MEIAKKSEEALLEEAIPWYSYSNENTLSSSFSFSKSFIFVTVYEKDDNDISIEVCILPNLFFFFLSCIVIKPTFHLRQPISVLPIVFWQKFTMNVPNAEGTTSPILWIAQRKGSINALKRIVNDATTSILYVTNELDQIPYLFSVKCGDQNMMNFTSNDGQLETFKDSMGRNAVFFSIFSFEASKLLFSGNNTSISELRSDKNKSIAKQTNKQTNRLHVVHECRRFWFPSAALHHFERKGGRCGVCPL